MMQNNPHSKLQRQIDQFLWTSVIFTSAVAAVSLMNMGRLSLFIVPCLFMITLAHNFTFLALASRDRRKSSDKLAGTLAPTASKLNIIFCWVLVGFWALTVLIIMITSVLIMGNGTMEGWEKLAGYFEVAMVVGEIVLMGIIAKKCMTQRKHTIIGPEHVDWQQYGGPPPVREIV
ncbi:hypothetical protein CVT26_003282 [Gymnopilus dilepis]|uniref:Uncharacterized protein n=1 Tax=Gymnopilus dilepis TaxID=231916 RepID=A0A409Y4X8_9AGAR|nr:hypothetical protein CVT26_003282 [Gymnopilus dilepis]